MVRRGCLVANGNHRVGPAVHDVLHEYAVVTLAACVLRGEVIAHGKGARKIVAEALEESVPKSVRALECRLSTRTRVFNGGANGCDRIRVEGRQRCEESFQHSVIAAGFEY